VLKPDLAKQGLAPDVILRLLSGTHTAEDRAKYYRTPWFRALTERAVEETGCCVLCGRETGLLWHHNPNGYKHMFREDLLRDGALTCKRCHRRHEGK